MLNELLKKIDCWVMFCHFCQSFQAVPFSMNLKDYQKNLKKKKKKTCCFILNLIFGGMLCAVVGNILIFFTNLDIFS